MNKYLDNNSGTECPESLFFFYCTTYRKYTNKSKTKFTDLFRSGSVSNIRLRDNKIVSEEHFNFNNVDKLITFIFSRLKKDRSNWVFSHGLSYQLQIINLFKLFASRQLILHEKIGDFQIGKPLAQKTKPWKGLYCVDDYPIFIRCRAQQGTIVFCDSMNYFRQPLQDLGEDLGVLPIETPTDDASPQDWLKVSSHNCAIIQKLMTESLISWKLGGFGNWNYTAAGLAWNNWRHSHGPKVVNKKGKTKVNVVIHDNLEVKQMERNSYHGGQICNFFTGYVSPMKDNYDIRAWSDDILHHLDCRSLYPYVMKTALYPANLIRCINKGTLAQLEHYSRSSGVIAEVRLKTDKIPFLTRQDGQLVYAVGNYTCTLCGEELARALEEGLIVGVGRIAIYYLADLFSSYVDYWYKSRLKNRVGKFPHLESFDKMMLNSLYGKFGQKSQKWVNSDSYFAVDDFAQWTYLPPSPAKPVELRSFCGEVQVKDKPIDGKNSFCAVSSFVTANAREYMRSIREELPPYSVYYQHTDSLIVNHAGFLAMQESGLIGPELGQFREVQEYTSSAEFFGPGDYIYGRSVVNMGRKANAKNLGPYSYSQDETLGLSSLIAYGPGEGVNGRIAIRHRQPDSIQFYKTRAGWAEPVRLDPHFVLQPALLIESPE